MAAVSQKLGVLGGTFDPVHHGHLVAAQEALFQLGLDWVLFVPAGTPPHKPKRPISPDAHRLRMLELALTDQPHFAISRVDVDRPGPHYTMETLTLLHEAWGPDVTFYFVEGTDSLADILNWRDPARILDLCRLAVVNRPDVEVDLARLEAALPGLRAKLHWVEMPLLEISSTDLRRRVREGRPISYLLPPEVEAYVLENGLYLNDQWRMTNDQ